MKKEGLIPKDGRALLNLNSVEKLLDFNLSGERLSEHSLEEGQKFSDALWLG